MVWPSGRGTTEQNGVASGNGLFESLHTTQPQRFTEMSDSGFYRALRDSARLGVLSASRLANPASRAIGKDGPPGLRKRRSRTGPAGPSTTAPEWLRRFRPRMPQVQGAGSRMKLIRNHVAEPICGAADSTSRLAVAPRRGASRCCASANPFPNKEQTGPRPAAHGVAILLGPFHAILSASRK
jgi:hypothetical protein